MEVSVGEEAVLVDGIEQGALPSQRHLVRLTQILGTEFVEGNLLVGAFPKHHLSIKQFQDSITHHSPPLRDDFPVSWRCRSCACSSLSSSCLHRYKDFNPHRSSTSLTCVQDNLEACEVVKDVVSSGKLTHPVRLVLLVLLLVGKEGRGEADETKSKASSYPGGMVAIPFLASSLPLGVSRCY